MLAGQHIIYIRIGIGADQHRHGMMEFVQRDPAVFPQTTDLHQPLFVPRIGTDKGDRPDIETVGRQRGVRFPDMSMFFGTGIFRYSYFLFQCNDLIPMGIGFLLSATDQRIECNRTKAGGIIRGHIRAEQQVGLILITCIFIMSV